MKRLTEEQELLIERVIKLLEHQGMYSVREANLVRIATRTFIELSKAEDTTPRRNPAADRTYCEAYRKNRGEDIQIPEEAARSAAKALAETISQGIETSWGVITAVPADINKISQECSCGAGSIETKPCEHKCSDPADKIPSAAVADVPFNTVTERDQIYFEAGWRMALEVPADKIVFRGGDSSLYTVDAEEAYRSGVIARPTGSISMEEMCSETPDKNTGGEPKSETPTLEERVRCLEDHEGTNRELLMDLEREFRAMIREEIKATKLVSACTCPGAACWCEGGQKLVPADVPEKK